MKKQDQKSKIILLVVGLGNPGEQYANTPHNAGFLVIDQLAEIYDLRFKIYEKLKSEIAETKINGKRIILAKPQTFMNKSGEAVKFLITNYKLPITSALWVIHDDIDLELGQIKIVRNRGSAGHKGVEDIMRKIKTQDFVRFRIGIRPKRLPAHRPKTLMNQFVVAGFTNAESKIFARAITKCKEAVILAVEEGVEKAASVFNR